MTADTTSGPELVTVEPVTTAVVLGTVAFSELRDFFDRSFRTLGQAVDTQGVTVVGPAFGLYRGVPTDTVDLEVGFPVVGAFEPSGGAEAGELPGGRVARAVHAGSFDELGASWQRLGGWITAQGLTPSETTWEVYVTEPHPEMDPAELRTELNWLLA
jgi:effector-binding domain-containing protein